MNALKKFDRIMLCLTTVEVIVFLVYFNFYSSGWTSTKWLEQFGLFGLVMLVMVVIWRIAK